MKPFRLTWVVLPGLLAPGLSAQRSERAVQSDMAFARELAARYQYIDLAESVLVGLSKEKLSSAQQEQLGLVQCQVYAEGAKRESDSKKRLELFDKAAATYRGYLDGHRNSELARQAERSYLTLLNSYGRALELALADAVGEEVQRLRETTQKVLDDGLERTGDLKDAYERPDLSQVEKQEKWRLMLERAQMLITLGNVSPDPEFPHRQAENELERVATDAGETSAIGLNACLALAKLNKARARYQTAADFAEFVVQTAVPTDPSLAEWQELPFEVRAERFKLVELALPDLVESHAGGGNTAKACQWALYFYNAWKREGFQLTPFGYLALLASARTLLDAGGFVGGSIAQGNLRWFESEEAMTAAGFSGRDARSALDLALQTAQDVNAENKGNTLQVRAQKLISDVIDRPGLVVPPEVLFEAALGEYNTGNNDKAIASFKDILKSLQGRDDATRQQYAPRVLFYVGSSLGRLGRSLEAAMAFREAATTWAGDLEYQERLARGFYAAIGDVRKASPGDGMIDQLYFQAEQLVSQSQGSGADDIRWRQAERAYDTKDFAGARSRYLEVGQTADEHEKALVKAALCLYKQKDLDGARKEFAAYVEQFVPDPQHAISGANKQKARAEARAQATFYLGRMAYDAQEWEGVLKWLEGYPARFPEQTEYGPNALFMVVGAHLARKDLTRAKGTCGEMQQRFATSPTTGKAALTLFQALRAEQQAAEQSNEGGRSKTLKREMAQYLHVANATSSEPPFENLRLESTLCMELGDWSAAEESLRTTLRIFQDKRERSADIERFVLPDLGQALLGQKRLPEAFEALDPLVPKDASDTRKPASRVVRDWCRAVCGWVEGDGNQNVEVPGVGGEKNFSRAVELLGKLVELEKTESGAWTCPWYQLKFDQIHAFARWGDLDSNQRQAALRLLEDLRGHLGDPELKEVATSCGDEVLRRRFRWLGNQLR